MRKFILIFNFVRPTLLIALFYIIAFPLMQWWLLLMLVFIFSLIDKSTTGSHPKSSKKADIISMLIFVALLAIVIPMNLRAGNYAVWHIVPFALLMAFTVGKTYLIFKPNAKLARFYS